jgi:hypothetical protein
VTFSNCVFQSNTFDYFLGTPSFEGGNATFINCIFDIPALNVTNSVAFSITGCSFETRRTFLTECQTRTPGLR